MPNTPGDRRPIAARQWRFSQRAAVWLARRGVSPNAISTAGMICGLLAGLCLAATSRYPDFASALWIAGAVLIVSRLLANMLDGMVAVESGTTSAVGELYNEVPDRISDAAALIGLGYAHGGFPTLGYWAALAADLTAYVRAVGKVAGAAQDYSGPFAKQQRMACVVAVAIVMAFVPVSYLPVVGEPAWRLPAIALAVLVVGTAFTAGSRLMRIARQLRSPK